MHSLGIVKLSKRLPLTCLEDTLDHLRGQLKCDEFQTLSRRGEYGKGVPSIARGGSQADHRAPLRRLNAFYTYCACEYLALYEKERSRNEIQQIIKFTERKLGLGARYYTTKADDGYPRGGYGPPKPELNIRHTLSLGLILAFLNQDHHRLDRIRDLLLESSIQAVDGGWYIWETDQEIGVKPDPICSSYAMILLDYFQKYPKDSSAGEEIGRRLVKTINYLVQCLDNTSHLWPTPGGGYAESLQMSVWYYTLLVTHLTQESSTLAREIFLALANGLSREVLKRIEKHPLGLDVKIRLAYAIILFGTDLDSELVNKAIEAIGEIAETGRPIEGLTTYALTRLMILLVEAKRIHLAATIDIKKEHDWGGTVAHLLGRFVRGYFDI